MKRVQSSSTSDGAPEPKKRKVTHSTYQKWRRDFDREHKTVTWLDCETKFEGGGEELLRSLSAAFARRRTVKIDAPNMLDDWDARKLIHVQNFIFVVCLIM